MGGGQKLTQASFSEKTTIKSTVTHYKYILRAPRRYYYSPTYVLRIYDRSALSATGRNCTGARCQCVLCAAATAESLYYNIYQYLYYTLYL